MSDESLSVQSEHFEEHEYADVVVDGKVVASVDVSDGTISVSTHDPKNPGEADGEFEYERVDGGDD